MSSASPGFEVSMPQVMTPEKVARVRAVLGDGTEQEIAQALREMLGAYEGLLARMRMADLMGYRAKLLADDMQSEIEAGKSRRSGPPSPEGIAHMQAMFVRDYVDVILPMLREALGFEEGAERSGWYLEAEDARAKIIGARRARERLSREGFGP